MDKSITEELTAPTGGKVASIPRPVSARPFQPGLWVKLRGSIWRIGIGLLVAAGVMTLVFWKTFAPVDVRSHEATSGDIVAEVMGTEFLVDVQPEKLPEQWSIGQRAEVYIETDRKSQATLVPSSFLVKRGDKAGMFVAVGGQAEWRPLMIGLQGRETLEVLDGLTPGEIVVAPPDPKAGPPADGRSVRLPGS